MQAVYYDRFQHVPELREVPRPSCPDHGVIVDVRATGVCRSDWHGWMGHDSDVVLPHVPGHEFAGVISEIGAEVTGWAMGDRVTAPFVNACGRCPQCREGRQQVCPNQSQPGFTRWGSFAESVVVDHAMTNLVALPDDVGFATAAGLGCRFATAYRAVIDQSQRRRGEWLAIFGCGGVGLSAVMIAVSRGIRVIAIDVSDAARQLAQSLGAEATIDASLGNVPAHVRDLTGDGAHGTLDALGRADTMADALACLRPGGRHVQVGLLLDSEANPPVDMTRVLSRELEIVGSHGMAAHSYARMLADIADGTLAPGSLVARTIGLPEAAAALAAMSQPGDPGTTVVIIGE